MKNQREIYEALLAGEKLTQNDWDKDEYIQIFNGMVVDENKKDFTDDFKDCDDWQIYKEPEWYESIPDGDVLCRVCEQEDWDEFEDTPRIITEFKDGMFYDSDGLGWPYVERLTKQETQVFMDNAPEIGGCRHNLLPDNPSRPQYYKCTKCSHVQGAKND